MTCIYTIQDVKPGGPGGTFTRVPPVELEGSARSDEIQPCTQSKILQNNVKSHHIGMHWLHEEFFHAIINAKESQTHNALKPCVLMRCDIKWWHKYIQMMMAKTHMTNEDAWTYTHDVTQHIQFMQDSYSYKVTLILHATRLKTHGKSNTQMSHLVNDIWPR